MSNIRILQYGKNDWKDIYIIPEYVEIYNFQVERDELEGLYDIAIIDEDVSMLNDFNELIKHIRAHCLYITENVNMLYYTQKLYDSKAGMRLYTGDIDAFFATEVKNYYSESYGEKFYANSLTVNQTFKGEIKQIGSNGLTLNGDFGDEFKQIAYWKHTIPVFEGQCIDMYLEYDKTEDVEIKMVVYQFYDGGTRDFQQIWEFSDEQLKEVVRIENEKKYGPVFVSILAKGKGELKIISLHDRYSRKNYGYFLPGGERFTASNGEEIFCYYDPGDLKPPLCFYFSGYRTQEGFEGYYMMRKFGCPFVLVCEPRLEGGGFYIGNEEYENLIFSVIKSYISKAGFDKTQVVMSGISMGTTGALYYGCKVEPHAIIVGKPLANLGNIANNERIIRAGGFPTSLDILLKNYGSLGDAEVKALNNRMWKRFEEADWSETKFIISYMYEDDYDMTGYEDILAHLGSVGAQIYGKGIHGRHNDDTSAIVSWFRSQYYKVLREDFNRRNN